VLGVKSITADEDVPYWSCSGSAAKESAEPSPRLRGCCFEVDVAFVEEEELEVRALALWGERRRSARFFTILILSMWVRAIQSELF
jgi:hypothetical protein